MTVTPIPIPPPKLWVRWKGGALNTFRDSEGKRPALRSSSGRGLWRGLVVVVLVLAEMGCGGAGASTPPSPGEAQQALRDFLDTWQRGGTSQQLTDRQPAIQGREPEWAAGSRLMEYTIAETGPSLGNSCFLHARLTIQRRAARQTETLNVLYTITSGNPIWIVRE
jgi:hypothetical protein